MIDIVKGGLEPARKVLERTHLFALAESLGGVESLIEQPTVISYWDQGPEKRAQVGIKDNLVRFSCGVECVEDLWADLQQALALV